MKKKKENVCWNTHRIEMALWTIEGENKKKNDWLESARAV